MSASLVAGPGVYLPGGGLQYDQSMSPASGTAYAVYIDYFPGRRLFKKVWCTTTSPAGTGACTAEAALFYSANAPNKAAQTLNKIVAGAFGGTDFQATQTAYHNSADFATYVPAGSHLWAVVRIVMATTQPTTRHLVGDAGRGYVLTFSGASALTGISSLSGGAVPAVTAWTTGIAPAIWVTEN